MIELESRPYRALVRGISRHIAEPGANQITTIPVIKVEPLAMRKRDYGTTLLQAAVRYQPPPSSASITRLDFSGVHYLVLFHDAGQSLG